MENENNAPQPGTAEAIREFGQERPLPAYKNPRGLIWHMPIIGHIEGHNILPSTVKTTKYEHVIPQLISVAENPDIEGLLVVLNTVGGDVEAGLAIAELISKLGKPTVSLVLGGCHSIGVPLAVAARFAYIAPSATMTLHPIRMNGTVVGSPQTYEYFNKMQERVDTFITGHSGIKKARLRRLMLNTDNMAVDVGTLLVGKEAVEEGLIQATGGLRQALERLYGYIERERRAQGTTATPASQSGAKAPPRRR